MIWHETDQSGTQAYQASDLKICDLCGALNLAVNKECFICRWRGHFERRPEVVTLAMELLERKHGSLEPALISNSLSGYTSARPPLRTRILHLFDRFRSRFLRREA
jgi:hypothetical protein